MKFTLQGVGWCEKWDQMDIRVEARPEEPKTYHELEALRKYLEPVEKVEAYDELDKIIDYGTYLVFIKCQGDKFVDIKDIERFIKWLKDSYDHMVGENRNNIKQEIDEKFNQAMNSLDYFEKKFGNNI